VKIYDILGREIKTLVSGFKSAGRHKVIWDGRDEQGGYISSGVYFCRMTAGSFSKTIKIVLTK
jgi:flagellar hook assembly protein FlgD